MTEDEQVPEGFYKTRYFVTRMGGAAYRAYCAARDAWLAAMAPPQALRILDVGCSRGEALAGWTAANFVVGVDRQTRVLPQARARGFVPVVADMFMLPFAPESFDLVCGLAIMGGRRDPRENLRPLYQALKPQGRLLLASPVLGGIRLGTRALVKLARVPTGMAIVPTMAALIGDLKATGFVAIRSASTALFPSAKLCFDPGWLARATATYVFIEAQKPG